MKPSDKMRKKIRCASCGKTTIVEVDERTGGFHTDWSYFGKLKLPNGKYAEYWECPECSNWVEEKVKIEKVGEVKEK
jgi:DNA-directed RNA polymerase subunit RPC12/RpoP